MNDCTTKAFDGCSCAPNECQSLTIRLEDHRRRYDQAVDDYRKSCSRFFCAVLVTIGLAGMLAMASASADEQFKQQDLRNQEIERRG